MVTESKDSPASKVNANDNSSIITSGLSKMYEKLKAVDSLNLAVDSGDIFGFLGPNGAGKTTTIRMLCGLIPPSAGIARVAGFDIIRESMKIRSVIGLLPESSGFYNWMNAEEYLFHFALLYKIEPSVARNRALRLIEKVGLAEKAHAPISYYSRGMRQRLGLARALINDPRIIFLDEPTLGLDPSGQEEIRKILLELNREKGVTIFLSSHALGEVSSLCNKIAVINHGQLIAKGNIDELRAQAGVSNTIVVRVVNTPAARLQLSNMPFQGKTSEEGSLISVTFSEGSQGPSNYDNVIECIIKQGLQVYDIRRPDTSLEEVFFKFTRPKNVDSDAEKNGGVR
ncbi:MAG: hypothetical protein AUH71_01050 [Thaumarchaeota archaeon 13_1_40CM_4_48_7]|nr:MAG: hypothetical protein AUH71_01050 [Thaumarchaeota archaeon 13_1_40CM_4_48_7]